MQRITTYKCEYCGTEFANKLDCAKHEEKCLNRRYYIERQKERIKAYLQSIEKQGFAIGLIYETANKRCTISIVDVKNTKK